jgi:lysozyme
MGENMKMSAQGRRFTERQEAPGGVAVLSAYQDPAGVWTIGFGHTKGEVRGMTCTPAQADVWMDEDLSDAENEINRLVKVVLTQNEFDALCDWEFNCGGLNGSTLLRILNAGRYEEVPAEMARWCHARVNGVEQVVPDLVRRRAAEGVLWMTPESDPSLPPPAEVAPIAVHVSTPATGLVPMRPPQTVMKTTTGKLQIGSLVSGGAAAVAASVNQIQPAVNAVHQVQSLTYALHGPLLYIVTAGVCASLLFTIFTLVHKHQSVTGVIQ